MPDHNLFLIFIERLNDLSVRYAVTGAGASTIYGEPRLTYDLDIILELPDKKIDYFINKFPLEDFYCPPREIIQIEIARSGRGHFNLINHQTGFKADIYLSGKDELHAWALSNRKSIEIEGHECWLAPIEYVILRKMEYFREGGSEKHLRDIKGILELSGDRIDTKFLKEKINTMKLETEWERVKSF